MKSHSTSFSVWLTLSGVLLVSACAGSSPGTPDEADGGDADSADDANPNAYCAGGTPWIYLLTFTWVEEPDLPNPGVSRADLVRFEPDSKTLTPLGELDCPGGEGPSSMAVDREGYAWVYFQASDNIFRVNLTDLECEATSYDSSDENFGSMGMAFVAESETAADETLYISGRAEGSDEGQLATLDTDTLDIEIQGPLAKFGELTGNALGELWSLRANRSPREVYQLDTDGSVMRTFDVDAIDTETSTGSSGYALAFWGGSYYIFYRSAEKHMNDESTTSGIWKLDPDTGDLDEVVANSGHTIVGAGVSTCAPVVLL